MLFNDTPSSLSWPAAHPDASSCLPLNRSPWQPSVPCLLVFGCCSFFIEVKQKGKVSFGRTDRRADRQTDVVKGRTNSTHAWGACTTRWRTTPGGAANQSCSTKTGVIAEVGSRIKKTNPHQLRANPRKHGFELRIISDNAFHLCSGRLPILDYCC